MVKATLEHSKELISQKVEKSKYYPLIGLESKPLTKEARKKIDELLNWMRTNPDTSGYIHQYDD